MRRTLIATLTVLALALSLGLAGQREVFRATDAALERQAAAEAAFRGGDARRAVTLWRELEQGWNEAGAGLRLVAHHDLMDRVDEALEAARLSLEAGDADGFALACAQAKRLIGHMRQLEAVSAENII